MKMIKMTKICYTCKTQYPITDVYFCKRSSNKSGYDTQCKNCKSKYDKQWYQKNRTRILNHRSKNCLIEKNNDIKRMYGIDYKIKHLMYEKQNKQCAICKISIELYSSNIDHCHETNIVRGLLCHKCNKGLGIFNDNIQILKTAINYLNRYKGENE